MAIIKVILGILVVAAGFTIPSLILAIRYRKGKKEEKDKENKTTDKVEKPTLKKIWWEYFKSLAAIPVAWYLFHLVFYLISSDIARAIWNFHWNYLMVIELSVIVLCVILNKRVPFEERTSRKLLISQYVYLFIAAGIIIIFRIGWSETAANLDRVMLSMLVNSKTELLAENIEKLTKAYRVRPALEKLDELHKKAKKLDQLDKKARVEFFSEFEKMGTWKAGVQKEYAVPPDKKIKWEKLWPFGKPEPEPEDDKLAAAAITKNPDGSWRVPVPSERLEVDSTLQVKNEQKVTVVATGKVNSCRDRRDGAYGWTGPEGRKWSWDKRRKRPLGQDAPFMALCAKIGQDGKWFYVGRKISFQAPRDGKIYFTVNDDTHDRRGRFRPSWRKDNEGRFIVKVKIV